MAHTRFIVDKQGYKHACAFTRPRALARTRTQARAHTHTYKYVILAAFPRQ